MNNFNKRTISSFILASIILFTHLNSNIYLNTFIFIISIIGLYEFYYVISIKNIITFKLIGFYITFLFFLNNIYENIIKEKLLFFLLIFLFILIFDFIKNNKKINLKILLYTFLGVLYVTIPLNMIYYISNNKLRLLIYIIAFSTDIFAYLIGSLFGKHKLAPKLSPKKSIEGSIGGIIGALLNVIIYNIFILKLEINFILIIMVIFSSIMSQLGDLAASYIKRQSGVKDYGYIIPGHGGILDRFDSVIFVSPIVFIFSLYLG